MAVGGCCLEGWDADDGMLCCVGLPTIGKLCNVEIYQANIKLLTIQGPHFFMVVASQGAAESLKEEWMAGV